MYHLTAFEYGQIKAHLEHEETPAEIRRMVVRPNGEEFSERAISNAIAKLRKDPFFTGERREGSGRPRATSKRVDNKILNRVLKYRGKVKVNVPWLKKELPELRNFSDTLVSERLWEAGLIYLRRRRKSLVPSKYIPERLEYAAWVLKQRSDFLESWAYVDGTVWFLEKTSEQKELNHRASLGPFVYRMADCSDALQSDCVGPSSYAKGQGTPVKVWGLLAKGVLHAYVLPPGQAMNRWWFAWLVEHRLADWAGDCKHIVQDYERCLRCDEPLAAMKKVGLKLVEKFPRCSQDLNAIEMLSLCPASCFLWLRKHSRKCGCV